MGDAPYHRECFTCGSCRRPIDGAYHTEDSELFCKPCYAKRHRPELCNACGKPIVGELVKADSMFFHAECFACVKYQRLILDG